MTGDQELAQDLRLAIGRFARRLRQLYADGDDRLTFLELAVLQRLDRLGPSTPTELATQEAVTSAAIAPVVRSLEEQGLLTRSADPSDGRRSIIAIAGEGRRVLGKRETVSVTRVRHALSTLDADARRQIARVIPLLEKVTSQL